MSYINFLSDPLFKKSLEGDTLFYPWSVLGKGYVIKPESRAQSVQAKLNWLNLGAMVVTMMCLQVLNWIYTAIVIGVYCVLYAIFTYRVTRGMQVSAERLKPSESLGKTVANFSLPLIVLVLVASIIFVALGVLIFLVEPKERLLASGTIIFFGFSAIVDVFMLRAKLRQRRRQT